MVSKGIDAYSFIAPSLPSYKVVFSVPQETVTHAELNNFSSSHLEIESKNIEGATNFVGRFSFSVQDGDGNVLLEKWVDINVFDGVIKAIADKMLSADQMTVVVGDVIISYLFYQAGKYIIAAN
jgi:hypothetical protein